MKNELGKYIEEYSVRNKEKKCDKVYSVTNSLGFVKSSDYFSKEVYSKDLSNYKIVLKNMIAYNPSRINVGSVSIQKKEDMVIVSPLYIVFSVNSKKLLPKYVNYFLHSDVALHQISNLTSGSVRDSLKYTSLKRIIIPVYSTEEQEKIINTLELLDEIIYKKNNQLKYFDDYIQFRFIEMFNREKEKCSLSDISIYIGRGKTPIYTENSSIKIINQACVFWDNLNVEKAKYHKEPINNVNYIKDGDLLVNSTGTGTLGRVSIFNLKEDKFRFVVDSHITILRLDKNKALPEYIINFFKMKETQLNLYRKCVVGSTNQIELSKLHFQKFIVTIPPLSLQNEFADFVREVDKSKLAVKKSLEELEILKKSLMQKYFS